MIQFYQNMKEPILEVLLLSKDAIHIHVGFACWLLSCLFLRRRSWNLLWFPFSFSLLMEIFDFVADQRRGVSFQWAAHLHDLLNTNLIPLILTICLVLKTKGAGTDQV